MLKKSLIAVLLMALIACNTVDGIGKDLRKGGEEIGKVLKSK
ncbi:MAG: entericidin [Gallionella sp.]